ncbi:MAG: acyl-CoA synthetase (AMP-forming)/AMP-acid ligase II [Akkermansiaceae bacterium]|jgi:acyl-CoA synthetase (AMP-forming)/AMP-acid ligase II
MNLTEKLTTHDPKRIAIIDRDRAITFGELNSRVQGGADLLRQKGLQIGDAILVLHPITIALYEILLSCFHAGIVVILVDPAKGSDFIKKCLNWLPPKAFIGSPKAQLLRLKYQTLKKAFSTGPKLPFTHHWNPSHVTNTPVNLPPDAPALVTFTSGSTGNPKGIVRSHHFLLAQDKTLSKSLNLQPGQIDLVTLPVFLLSNLSHGITSVIADTDLTKPGFPEVPKILSQIEQHPITRCTASPAFFEKMPAEFFASLTELYTGGAPVFPDLLSRFPKKSHAVYGSSEAEPISHFHGSDLTPEVKRTIKTGGGLPAGKPVAEISLQIIDDEILVTGDHVLKGYLDGRGNAETKIKIDGQIWHRTGDAGRLDNEGNLWLLGRHSQKYQDHYPLQIEAAVHLLYPGERCAFLKGTLFLEKDLKIALPWAPIAQIKVIDQIPMDSRHNAKVDYAKL